MKSILVSVPNEFWTHKIVTRVLFKIHSDPRYKTEIIDPTHRPFENNLHHIIKDFLKGDYDFWLSIDSDNPPIKNPLDLALFDLDIVGLPTPVWHCTGKNGERPYYWNAYDYVEEEDAYREHQPQVGLQQVDAIGTGCFLAARRVFECERLQNGAFTRKLNKDGTVDKGNDISFCERATEEGFKIYSHYDYPCRHYVEVDLIEMIQAFNGIKS
jgi:hypothetical protein